MLSKTKTDPFNDLAVALNTRVGSFPLSMRRGMLIRVLRNASEFEFPKDVPEGTPAWCDYRTETIYVSAEAIWGEGKPAEEACRAITKGIRDGFGYKDKNEEKRSLLYGMLNHEISHAWNSRWAAGQQVENKLSHTVMIMEEIRVESLAVNKGGYPAIEVMRKSFAWILNSLMEQDNMPDSPRAVAALWALVVGRHRAGIAMWEEVESVDIIARSSIGDSTVDIMNEILTEAIDCDDFDKRMDLAREWNDLFPPEEDESGEGGLMSIPMGCSGDHEHEPGEPGEGDGEGGEKGDGEGEGEGTGEGEGDGKGGEGDGQSDEDGNTTAMGKLDSGDSDAVSMIRGAIRKMKESVSTKQYIDTTGKKLADTAKELAAALRRKRDTGQWITEDVTADDRKNSRVLARQLSNLALPSVTKVRVGSTLPPGRMRGRGVVQKAAEKNLRLSPQAQPFETTKRTRTQTKPVIVGCMTDTSGSMSWATEFVGHFAWVVSKAGKAIGARTAALTFGAKTHIVVKPGDNPDKVHVRQAWDGWECFDSGCATIDGLLKYRDTPNASKVLFIVSDGHFVGTDEVEKCCMWIEELTKAGTTIVWVSAEAEYSHYEKHVRKPGAMETIDVPYRKPDLNVLFKDMEAVIKRAAAATR